MSKPNLVHELPLIHGITDIEKHLALAAWKGSSGYCVVSNSGILLAVNEHLCRLLNYTQSELVGMHFNDITLNRDQNADATEFASLIRGDKNYYHMNKTWIGKLNQPVSGHLFVIRFESGEIIFAISQIIEGLSPEQVGAFAVMVRSLMEDWLSDKGIKMTKETKISEQVMWYKNPIVWAAIGGAGAIWPIVVYLAALFRRIADVLYPVSS